MMPSPPPLWGITEQLGATAQGAAAPWVWGRTMRWLLRPGPSSLVRSSPDGWAVSGPLRLRDSSASGLGTEESLVLMLFVASLHQCGDDLSGRYFVTRE